MPLNQTTAIIRVYMPVRKSDYWAGACHPRYTRWRCAHFNSWYQKHLRLTSLHHQLPRHSRKMAYEERDEATSLYTSYMVNMIITQPRCTMTLLLAMISEERRATAAVRLLPAHSPGEKSRACAERKIQSDPYTCRSNVTINRIIWVL